MNNIKSYNDICDYISFTAYCPAEPGIMVIVDNNEYCLPRIKALNGASINDIIMKESKDIFGESIAVSKLGSVIKIWTPYHPRGEQVMHYIFGSICNLDQKRKSKNATGKYRGLIRWLSEQDIKNPVAQENNHGGPMLLYMYLVMRDNKFMDAEKAPELLQTGAYVEMTDRCLVSLSGGGAAGIFEQLLAAAGFNQTVQVGIYKEFITACFPSLFISYSAFSKFITSLGWARDDVLFLFRAADLNDRKSLSFRDFMYIVAALEPSTNHAGGAAEVRSRYIFRFFDRDRDGFININELRIILTYLRKIKSQALDVTSIDKDMESCCRALNFTNDKKMAIAEFLVIVSELKIRGMSQVLRTQKSIKSILQLGKDIKMQNKTSQSYTEETRFTVEMKTVGKPIVGNYCRIGPDFEVALHTVKVQKSGTMINLDQLFNLKTAVSATTLTQANITEKTRRVSLDVYGQGTLCNQLMRSLRTVVLLNNVKAGNRGNKKDTWTWGNTNVVQFAERLLVVCNQTKQHLRVEARMLDLRSPCYVMGDVHGNYGDMQFMEKMFWPLSPGICPATLLFLGDYVDRGPFSIEVITYLFCYKSMFPHKIKLIRGNHEIREIQKMFTFYGECILKFGDKLGVEVWNAVNEVFDLLPLAAVIDGKIFCVHGGIPPPWLCPSAMAINNIITPLSKPDEQSSLAWEIMWNDPIKDSAITDDLKVELLANDGFAKNVKRGTAHVFNNLALDRFLNSNGFTHILRAHEVVGCGFNVQMKGRLLTVFSSSRYGNQQNESACVLVDSGKLRMLRLDTST